MIILILASLMIASGAYLIWHNFYGHKSFDTSTVKLPKVPSAYNRLDIHKILGVLSPLTRPLAEKLHLESGLKMRLDASHIRMSPAEFLTIKLLLMILLAVGISIGMGSKLELTWVIVGLAIGYLGPDLYLKQRIAKRKNIIGKLLPETVDLLGLCVEAGLDFTTAVKWIIDKVPSNPLLQEFSFVLEEIKWGKPRIQALKDMSKRLNIPEVSSFVQTLVQADRMGTPVSEAFGILSEDVRQQRFHRGERIALQAPIKILIPLIFCILPVIGIVIGGPIFLQFMGGNILQGLGGGGK